MNRILITTLIGVLAWFSLTVISNSGEIGKLNVWKSSCNDVHRDIKTGISDLRKGQTEILKILIN